MIPVYTPALQVLLIKMQGQQGTAFTAGRSQTDLTPYLGDGGAVRTVKGLASPAGGFSISFSDQFDPQTADTVAALVEPMDVIEIRASRTPGDYAGEKLPLIMRGFVSSVRRPESMGPEGPERSVVIQGQDAGKLWLTNQILFEVVLATNEPYLSAFQLQTATGIDIALLGVSDFMTQLTQKVMNKKIDALNAFSSGQVKPFVVDASVNIGQVMPQSAASFNSQAVWNLVETFADRPWNEAFIIDQEDGPHFVFRPAAFKDVKGNMLGAAVDPGTIPVDIADVISMDMVRSDSRVANFFFVPPGNADLFSGHAVSVQALITGTPLDNHHQPNSPDLFGLRKMTATSNLLPGDIAAIPSMLSATERQPAIGNVLVWSQTRAQLLRDMNRDNVLFEEGSITLKGSEDYQIGQYLQLTRGSIVSEAYIASVSHAYAPLQGWTSNLMLERGNGFIVRSKMGGQPYWSEGRDGPYSP